MEFQGQSNGTVVKALNLYVADPSFITRITWYPEHHEDQPQSTEQEDSQSNPSK